MMTIAYKGLGNSSRGLTKCLSGFDLGCVARQERNAKIFYYKARTLDTLWDTIHFLASF